MNPASLDWKTVTMLALVAMNAAGGQQSQASPLFPKRQEVDPSARALELYRTRTRTGAPVCLSANARPYAPNQTIVCAPRATRIPRLPLPSERFEKGEVIYRPWEIADAPVRGRIVGSCGVKRGRSCAGMLITVRKDVSIHTGLHNMVVPKVALPPEASEDDPHASSSAR